MLVSLDFFGYDEGALFDTKVAHYNYSSVEVTGGVRDHLHINQDLNISKTLEKTEYFTYDTVMNASFRNNLEGGSIENSGREIEKIRFQRRRSDELHWNDVAELVYDFPKNRIYETLDKHIQNDFEYEYALLPVTSETLGLRVKSEPIVAQFSGFFISDRDHNFQLLFNAEMGAIEHVSHSSILEPLNSRFPIITYGVADYRKSSMDAVIISPSSYDNGNINIRAEKLNREKVIAFLRSRKPMNFRGMNGESMLIAITGNPLESHNKVAGVASISFDFVEIGNMDSDTLKENGLIEGLSGVW